MSIEVTNITKSFGSFKALDNVTLAIKTGELMALLGPSGSGKTTLLRIMAGLEQPDPGSGDIKFHDEDMGNRRVSDRGVGFVFQHYALFRHMTVFENIAFGLRVRPPQLRPSRRDIRARVMKLLKLVQLENMAGRRPHQLSGGQRQRIALARALAVEPRVLLLDEPFGALDAKVRQELRRWLRRLHEEIHVTSVFVTHDQDEALEVSDSIVVMNQGRIEQTGTPDEVFHNPKTEFVMHFLGEVNAFHGRVDSHGLRLGSLELPYPEESQPVEGDAKVFIRPYDVTLDTKTRGLPAIEAEVVHVHAAGPLVRVELKTSTDQRLVSEISQERFGTMELSPGTKVCVRLRHIRVFADTGSG
jgi:sulfate/thiosulfate transport system ATP-binding protein